ncbi:uncharacterized protein LOC130689463 [Daphnia carinata]|uniref:uncharacterized protein LOC130689463 n=1 Tax=Daphnia carinata TaxID=120202 RepID=UPI00257E4E60|nr:uncharacterized protein LOC130689463 [Daphnia carinata]
MQKIIFLLLSFSVAFSLSNPVAERAQTLNVGDVIALFDADEPDQPAVLFVQQATTGETPVLRTLTPEESKDEDKVAGKDCEGCDGESETQERSFLFKKLFLSHFVRPVTVAAAPPVRPRPVAPPSAFLIGTVYQPTSFVAAPVKTTGSVAGVVSIGGQTTMQLAQPSTGLLSSTVSQMSPGAGISGQQLMQGLFPGGQSAMQVIQAPTTLPTTGAGVLGSGLAMQQSLQGPFIGGQQAVQAVAPPTGFSAFSAGQAGGMSALQQLQGPQLSALQQLQVPPLAAGTRPAALQVPTGTQQVASPPSGLFPNAAGQGNIGINVQQSSMPHSGHGPTPNSVATINISNAEIPEAETDDSPVTPEEISCSNC